MTAAYVDTSCLMAVASSEPGYEELATRLESFSQLHASNLLEAEFASALARRHITNDGSLTDQVIWVLPDRALTLEIDAVLAAGYLRGADLWHVACALYLSPNPLELTFLTLDGRQSEVARNLGFPA
ncbi:MAG: type II toxin-antitoxin system VapC family toxin [Chloroflexi bacterium]|nr:type II toxin-antitoxin system VapC family toxin [Chloroflexota bacterium]